MDTLYDWLPLVDLIVFVIPIILDAWAKSVLFIPNRYASATYHIRRVWSSHGSYFGTETGAVEPKYPWRDQTKRSDHDIVGYQVSDLIS